MSAADHKPVLFGLASIGRTRVDCTCGAKDLATVRPTDGMAPVISAIKRHREAQQ